MSWCHYYVIIAVDANVTAHLAPSHQLTSIGNILIPHHGLVCFQQRLFVSSCIWKRRIRSSVELRNIWKHRNMLKNLSELEYETLPLPPPWARKSDGSGYYNEVILQHTWYQSACSASLFSWLGHWRRVRRSPSRRIFPHIAIYVSRYSWNGRPKWFIAASWRHRRGFKIKTRCIEYKLNLFCLNKTLFRRRDHIMNFDVFGRSVGCLASRMC